MTSRVLLGVRGAEAGLWVSRPGFDVVTTARNRMMLATDSQSFQVLQSGTVGFPGSGGDASITIPDQGFTPLVLLSCPSNYVSYWMASNTQLRIRGFGIRPSISWPTSGSTPVSYAVTNLPLHH